MEVTFFEKPARRTDGVVKSRQTAQEAIIFDVSHDCTCDWTNKHRPKSLFTQENYEKKLKSVRAEFGEWQRVSQITQSCGAQK